MTFDYLNRAASTSVLVQRISAEQAMIEARLLELEGMENIQTRLRNTRLGEDEEMKVDEPEQPMSRAINAKQRVLSKYVCCATTKVLFTFTRLK